MGLKNKELDEMICQFFDKNEYVENCILINADEQNALVLGKEADKLYLKKDCAHNTVMVQEEVNNGLSDKLNPEIVDEICNSLHDTNSEVNRKLRRYIVSDKLMDESIDYGQLGSASCSEIEDGFSKCKDGIIYLLKEIDEICKKSQIAIDNCLWVVAGKITNSFLVRYYYSKKISGDPIIANPKLIFFANGFSKSEYTERIENTSELLKHKTELKESECKSVILVSLYGENKTDTVSLSINEDDNTIHNYIGPIFVSVDDKFEVHLDNSVKKIAIPYNIFPLDCDLVDIAAIREKNQLFLRIRRTQFPTRMYDIPLERETI